MAGCVSGPDTLTWRQDEEYAVLFKSPISQVLGYAMAALLDRAVCVLWLPVNILRKGRGATATPRRAASNE